MKRAGLFQIKDSSTDTTNQLGFCQKCLSPLNYASYSDPEIGITDKTYYFLCGSTYNACCNFRESWACKEIARLKDALTKET